MYIENTFTKEQIEKFWSKVDKKSDDECWEWKGAYNTKTYIKVRIGEVIYLAHRVAWVIKYGALAEFDDLHRRLCVCHKCDNTRCVNPNHLFLGTHKDNMRDMCKKGRKVIGEAHGKSKLTDNEVVEIREKYAVGAKTKKELSKLYNVSIATIHRIVYNESWKHLLDEWEK